jgi:uncharacterized damage-inducible protein DinB
MVPFGAMSVRELLIDTLAHIPPGSALERLTPEEAERRVPGATHSIAEIVAHMNFWATWFCDRCDGTRAPMVTSAAMGWPEVAPRSWPVIQGQFLSTLERAVAIGHDPARLESRVTPAIEFPPLARMTIHDALVHVSTHNAHHLGQVIILRQLMGLWPPPAGSYTW